MPIHQTLDASTIDLSMFVDADAIRVGEAYARLHQFVQGTDALDVFSCDAGTYSALKRAAARIAGIDKDKATTVRYVQRSQNGRKVWKRLAKSATVKQNDTTREGIIRSYSSDALRKGIETLREARGVSVKRQATTGDGETLVVALVRTPVASQ